MKTLTLLAFPLLISTASAASRLTLRGDDAEHSNLVVTFQAPAGFGGNRLLVDPGNPGRNSALQLDESGRGSFFVPHIGKGESIAYTFAAERPSDKTTGVAASKKGSVVELSAVSGTNAEKPQVILDYQMQPGDVPEGVAPIFKHGAHLHPVFSPSGKLVTGNHPPDHRWHRGIWMAWTETDFGGRHPDFWNMGKGDGKEKSGASLLAEVRFQSMEKTWSGPVHGGFVSRHKFIDHTSGSMKDVLDETWEVSVFSTLGTALKPMFVIDLTSTQTCSGTSALKLPKYHYGGLGVRGNRLWDAVDKVAMLTSNGDDRLKGDSTKGKWVHLGGDVDGTATGIAVLIHPDNFRFPQPLRLNPKNPQICIAPSQDGDWSIEPGKPYLSKYRIIIVDGAADKNFLDAQWDQYAKPLKVTVE